MTTVIEMYNEDDNTINHHGFQRDVKAKGNEIAEKVKFRAWNMSLTDYYTYVSDSKVQEKDENG